MLFLLFAPRAFVLGAPELDFVFELYATLASHALSNLFRERERVRCARVLAFGDDEVGVYGGDDGASAPRPLHPHLVDHAPGADGAARWILEEAAGRARPVRLRRQAFALSLFHTLLYLFGVVRLKSKRCAQEQLAFAKRGV